ncbi:MIP/aquaporin family protein [Candidatus Uabimicrobium sp. HlEnr_7]|uniref:MIP/aquaporin family protein n=1 Tax=Candidatus Uabimicrobium helgolandensis TaxID=3095367 RepID=UPI0035571E36
MKSYIMEFIGTMFLVLAIGLTQDPLAIGIMLTAIIYAGGHISGAHYNPAITIAIWMRGKLATKYVAGYILMQILGAFVAAALCYYMAEKTFVPNLGEGITVSQAIIAEIIFTFLLAMVILNVATSSKLEGNYIYGLAIGFTVTASAFCVGGISGAVLNPAVGLSFVLVGKIINSGISIEQLYIYLTAPFVGGILAFLAFRFLNSEEFTSD